MTPLRLAVLIVLGAALSRTSAAPPAPAATYALEEPAALAAAQAYTADVCRRVPGSCAEARALESAYKEALASATACERAGCPLETARAIASILGELDKRDAELPLPADGRLERAFLSLSVIATSRLSVAATRLGSPDAAATWGASAGIRLQRSLAAYCLAAAATCGEMRALAAGEEALAAQIKACAPANCSLEAADPLVTRANAAFGQYFALDSLAKSDTLGVFILVNQVNADGIALYVPLADRAVSELSEGIGRLQRNIDRAEKDASVPISVVEADGPVLLESHRRAARAADRLSFFLGYRDETGAAERRRQTVNAAAIMLSGLRGRALALRAARGLGASRDERLEGAGAVAAAGMAAGASAGAPPALAMAMAEAGRTILDRRLVPPPQGGRAAAPDILAGERGPLALARDARSSDPVLRADALRRLNLTKTLGDPGRYAQQAFTQESNDSCAVAVQVAVLRAHGLLPTTVDPHVQERALLAEARARGYMMSGTPPEYSASLLIERGMLVSKRPRAEWPEFEEALRRGALIQAGVDAAKLWKVDSARPLAHSILVTGAEVSRFDREILGVYINDTGTQPPGAGKFVPIGEFRAAWKGSFAEVR